jgi:hypothetical protein
MADSSNLIKAEDARIVGDMKLMKRYYADLLVPSSKRDPTTTRSS